MKNGPEWMDEERSGAAMRAGTDAASDAVSETEVAAADTELLALDPELMVLERELSAGLRPFELPFGFADRVMAAAEGAKKRPAERAKVLPFRSALRAWRLAAGGAIAASVLAGSFVMDEMHQRRERERAQVTEQQLETAVQVSNHALDEARAQLQRAAFRLNQ